MADHMRIDSHKLIYHPERVGKWLKGENIYPIYVEIAPSGTCNHRCIFCAMDYMAYKPILQDYEVILKALEEMATGGVKSVMYAGEGEPLVNQLTPKLINATKALGIDVSMTTNGVLMTPEVTDECFAQMTWVRFSINAGSPENYKKIHCGLDQDYEKVMNHLAYMVDYKKHNQLKTTIGTQMLLIPENAHEVLALAKQLKTIGVDYFSVKPYSQHPLSGNTLSKPLDYAVFIELESELRKLETDNFKVIFRVDAMKKLSEDRSYSRCLGLPFWAYIDAKANIWGCSAYLGDERFLYGNLKEMTFDQIWVGEKRKASLAYTSSMDTENCREICRLDCMNRYLDELRNPGEHVNFI